MIDFLLRLRGAWSRCRYGSIDPAASLGRRGEQAAAILLRRKGLLIVEAGYTDRAGEIDLIAIDRRRQMLVFVEVKTLATSRPGHPADRVDDQKQRRITTAALRYLQRRKLLGTSCRFDVIAIWWPGDSSWPTRIEHYESAFDAVGDFQFFS